MRTITNNELRILASELNNKFKDYYIEKFYEVVDDQFLIKLSKQHEKVFMQIILCHTINSTDYIIKNEFPTNFTLAVRKKIENFKIDSIEQYNNDRIIFIKLIKSSLKLNLFIEMFGRGNFIITDEAFKILLVYKPHIFKDRNMNVGAQYIPPATAQNNISMEENINKIENIILYKDKNNKIVNYSLKEDPKYSDLTKEYVSSMEKALELYYKYNPISFIQKTAIDRKIEELEESIKKQEKYINESKIEYDELIKKGQFLINNINLINELIFEVRKNQKIEIETLNKKFQNINVINIDLKNKHITIKVDL